MIFRMGWKTGDNFKNTLKIPSGTAVTMKRNTFPVSDGVPMKTYTVYRVEYPSQKIVKIGTVTERRGSERYNNTQDMMRLAQKLYATSTIDSHIFIVKESSHPRLSFEGPYELLDKESGNNK